MSDLVGNQDDSCPGAMASCPGAMANCPGAVASCPGAVASCPGAVANFFLLYLHHLIFLYYRFIGHFT